MNVFETAKIGKCTLQNRIIRSATYEGMCDPNGYPGEEYKQMYVELAKNGVGAIITGSAFISREGKAMQPGQAGMDEIEKVAYFREVTEAVHREGGKIFLQLVHTGRQTQSNVTGMRVRGASRKKSVYFGEKPEPYRVEEVLKVVGQFTQAALWAKEAGFDGVQIHAAHGYLIHQFLLPAINTRHDLFGIDWQTKLGTKLLELVIDQVRAICGEEYPILVKISRGDDYFRSFSRNQFIQLIRFLDRKQVDAIEISYGTMDYALSIFRGEIPIDLILRENPVYRVENPTLRRWWKRLAYPLLRMKIKPFKPMYNLDYAILAKSHTDLPVIVVGGFRRGEEIHSVIEAGEVDFVSLCRPFLAEPDFARRLAARRDIGSRCVNCNLCVIMCNSEHPTQCYKREKTGQMPGLNEAKGLCTGIDISHG